MPRFRRHSFKAAERCRVARHQDLKPRRPRPKHFQLRIGLCNVPQLNVFKRTAHVRQQALCNIQHTGLPKGELACYVFNQAGSCVKAQYRQGTRQIARIQSALLHVHRAHLNAAT